jgi:predicted nicotinamide N-methyase
MATGIAEKYDLKCMPVTIGGKTLNIYTVENWDAFVERLEREGKEYVTGFPFWVKIWKASIVLTDHLIRSGLEKQKHILEIGAGMGITGLFLGALGYNVTITDYEEDALDLLQMNAETNRLDGVSVKKLDWSKPSLTSTYDIICGSELIYKEQFIRPIINLFREYLRPKGTVYLAHDMQRKCLVQFIGTVPGRFEIENRVKTMKGKGEIHRIAIHVLRLK